MVHIVATETNSKTPARGRRYINRNRDKWPDNAKFFRRARHAVPLLKIASVHPLPQLCIAVIPASAHGPDWLPCKSSREPGGLLCTTHYDMFVGIILGFQNSLKLPDHPFVDPRILKRLYAKLKKTKRRRPGRNRRKQISVAAQDPLQQTQPLEARIAGRD